MFLTLVGMGGMMLKKQNICLNVMLTHASLSTVAFVVLLVYSCAACAGTVHGQCGLACMTAIFSRSVGRLL